MWFIVGQNRTSGFFFVSAWTPQGVETKNEAMILLRNSKANLSRSMDKKNIGRRRVVHQKDLPKYGIERFT